MPRPWEACRTPYVWPAFILGFVSRGKTWLKRCVQGDRMVTAARGTRQAEGSPAHVPSWPVGWGARGSIWGAAGGFNLLFLGQQIPLKTPKTFFPQSREGGDPFTPRVGCR
jgi:hypothetical protein